VLRLCGLPEGPRAPVPDRLAEAPAPEAALERAGAGENAPASLRHATAAARCAPAHPNLAVSPAHTYLAGNWFSMPERLESIP
jgi:hypothetical protein